MGAQVRMVSRVPGTSGEGPAECVAVQGPGPGPGPGRAGMSGVVRPGGRG